MDQMDLYKKVYKALSLVALEMAKNRGLLNEKTIVDMRKILED